MPSKITVTGTIGPGLAVTAMVINNVTDLDFQLDRQVLQVTHDSGQITSFQLSNLLTVTYTISAGGVATVVAST